MKEYISEIVYSKIREALDNPNVTIHKTDRLIEDLNIDDDELSFYFVNDLEEACNVERSDSDWEAVSTVQDVADLLYKEEKKKEARGEKKAQRRERGFPMFITLYILFIVSLLLLLLFM